MGRSRYSTSSCGQSMLNVYSFVTAAKLLSMNSSCTAWKIISYSPPLCVLIHLRLILKNVRGAFFFLPFIFIFKKRTFIFCVCEYAVYLRVVLNFKWSNSPRYFQGTHIVPSYAASETFLYIYISPDGSPLTVTHSCKFPNINIWVYHLSFHYWNEKKKKKNTFHTNKKYILQIGDILKFYHFLCIVGNLIIGELV